MPKNKNDNKVKSKAQEIKELYEDTIKWMIQSERHNCRIICETNTELKRHQEYFKKQILKNSKLDDSLYDRIEWKVSK